MFQLPDGCPAVWEGRNPCLGKDQHGRGGLDGSAAFASPFPCRAARSGDLNHWVGNQEILFKAVCPLEKILGLFLKRAVLLRPLSQIVGFFLTVPCK